MSEQACEVDFCKNGNHTWMGTVCKDCAKPVPTTVQTLYWEATALAGKEAKITELSAKAQALEARIDEVAAQRDAAIQEAASLGKEAEAAEARCAEKDQRIAALEKELEAARKNAEYWQKEHGVETEKRGEAEHRLDQERGCKAEAFEKLERERDSLAAQLSAAVGREEEAVEDGARLREALMMAQTFIGPMGSTDPEDDGLRRIMTDAISFAPRAKARAAYVAALEREHEIVGPGLRSNELMVAWDVVERAKRKSEGA